MKAFQTPISPHSSVFFSKKEESVSMGKSGKIIRNSVHTFLENYHFFTCVAALLAFPFSLSVLLSQALVFSPFSHLPNISLRLRAVFQAAGFPSSDLGGFLLHKLAQTISCSVLTLPFSLTFLLITKSSVIQILYRRKKGSFPSFSSIFSLYRPLLFTSLCNSFFIVSANATVFSVLFFAFNLLEEFSIYTSNFSLFLSVSGAVFYSIVLANALMISNLALVLSGMENHGGFPAILKACVLIRGRTSTALSLSLPINLALASVESWFRYRIVRPYFLGAENRGVSMITEGIFIAYLYSILVVLDTIMNVLFFKSSKTDFWIDFQRRREEQEQRQRLLA